MFDGTLLQLAATLLEGCRERGIMLATAESCTGGLIAGVLTAIPGASDVVERGFITYSNQAKAGMLGIDPGLIEAEGAVSRTVAIAMTQGALRHSPATLALAVTGIAGPGGGTPEKPVGLVHIAAATPDMTGHREYRFADHGRDAIRRDTIIAALKLGLEILG